MYPEHDDGRADYATKLVALFIDWDNFTIGLREEMPGQPPDPGPMLRWARRFGTLVVCRAYGEWRDPAERLAIYNVGVETIYAPVLPLSMSGSRANGGGKSLADTAMAVDCVDVIHLMPGLSTLIVASSDKDLIPILRFAQRRGLHVYVLGSDRTAAALRDMADETVSYRALLEADGVVPPPSLPVPSARRPGGRTEGRVSYLGRAAAAGPLPLPGVRPPASPPSSAAPAPSEAPAAPVSAAPLPEVALTEGAAPSTSGRRRRRGGRRRRPAATPEQAEAPQMALGHDEALAAPVEEAQAALEAEAAAEAVAANEEPAVESPAEQEAAGAAPAEVAPPSLIVEEEAPPEGEMAAFPAPEEAIADGAEVVTPLPAQPAEAWEAPVEVPAVGATAGQRPVVLRGERLSRLQRSAPVSVPEPPPGEPAQAALEPESSAETAAAGTLPELVTVLPGEKLLRARRRATQPAPETAPSAEVVAPAPGSGPAQSAVSPGEGAAPRAEGQAEPEVGPQAQEAAMRPAAPAAEEGSEGSASGSPKDAEAPSPAAAGEPAPNGRTASSSGRRGQRGRSSRGRSGGTAKAKRTQEPAAQG